MSDTRNLRQRMLAVMADAPKVLMNGTAPKDIGGFKFVKHDDVTSTLRPLFVKHGVLAMPSVIGFSHDGNRVVLEVRTTFLSADTEESLSVVTIGHGVDKGDKGPGKALSYAVKLAYLKALSLETGLDVENDASEYAPGGSRGPQTRRSQSAASQSAGSSRPGLTRFWTAARNGKVPDDAIRGYLGLAFGVTTTRDLTDEQLDTAAAWARTWIDRMRVLGTAAAAVGMTDLAPAEAYAANTLGGPIPHLPDDKFALLVEWVKSVDTDGIPF